MEETRKKQQVSGGSDQANISIIKKFCLDLYESINKFENESQSKCRLTVGRSPDFKYSNVHPDLGSERMATIADNMEHSGL